MAIVTKPVLGMAALAMTCSVTITSQAQDFSNERYLAARDMLLVSCLGYAEGRFDRPDLSSGKEVLPGLIISNRGVIDPTSYCQVTDTNDNGAVYDLMIKTIQHETSPFELVEEQTNRGIYTKHYRFTKSKNDIGLILSRDATGESDVNWIASVAFISRDDASLNVE